MVQILPFILRFAWFINKPEPEVVNFR